MRRFPDVSGDGGFTARNVWKRIGARQTEERTVCLFFMKILYLCKNFPFSGLSNTESVGIISAKAQSIQNCEHDKEKGDIK